MGQDSKLQEIAGKGNPNGFDKSRLREIQMRNPGKDVRVVRFSDGFYVQFYRRIKNGETSSDNYSFEKLE